MGLDEIITYSFISPAYYDKIRMPAASPLRDSLRILNPLGEDTSIMRTTVLPSMLEILSRNYNNRNKQAALYEIGKIYLKRPDGLADEPSIVSLGAYGPDMSFFTLKGWVEELMESLDAGKLRGRTRPITPAAARSSGPAKGKSAFWARFTRRLQRTMAWTRSSTARSCALTRSMPSGAACPYTGPCPVSRP